MSQAETQANCERPNIPQISSGGVFGDLGTDRKTMKSSVECANVFLNDNMIIKAGRDKKKRNIKEKCSALAHRVYVSLCLIGSLGSGT